MNRINHSVNTSNALVGTQMEDYFTQWLSIFDNYNLFFLELIDFPVLLVLKVVPTMN